jgi:sodium-dependent dicarboxylate transporter 2/3/5
MAVSAHTQDVYPWRVLSAFMVACGCFLLTSYASIPSHLPLINAQKAAAVMAFVICLWLFQAMDVAGASMLPLVLLPLLGVSNLHTVSQAYAHPIVWVFWGGMVLASGIEKWNVHKRWAVYVIKHVGSSPRKWVVGSMAAATCVSMWMNNTATMLLLLPIATALIHTVHEARVLSEKSQKTFAFAMVYGVAVSCTIGGLATPVGTAPNGIFFSHYARMVEQGAPPVSFAQWMLFGMPLACVFWAFTAWFLVRGIENSQTPVHASLLQLPPASSAEKRMMAMFALLALLWATRADMALPFHLHFPGWWRLLPVAQAEDIGDGAVAVGVAVLCMWVPSGRVKGETLLAWKHLTGLPWDILMLLGGGMALANSFGDTGLAHACGAALGPLLQNVPLWAMLLVVCFSLCFISELASNVAVASLFLPIFASVATSSGFDPRILMIPATLSASLGFMLPIATPPNAIAYATGFVPMKDMAKKGWVLNVVGVILIALATRWIMVPLLDLKWGHTPTWAQDTHP